MHKEVMGTPDDSTIQTQTTLVASPSADPPSPPNPPYPETQAKRAEFLLEVYKEMMNDINRHIVVVWQSIGVVVGSFAVMQLVEKKVVSPDFAAAILILVCAWSLALLLDSSYWYNRNLCIIANIEKLFLKQEDLKNVHYYFGAHRPNNRMITTLQVQVALSLGVALLVLLFHFWGRVLPGFSLPMKYLDVERGFPYLVALGCTIYLLGLRVKRNQDYQEFIQNSPGISVKTDGIQYGGGHGFKEGGG